MKIKCIFLLYLFLVSTYSNGDQPESDLTKVSKQIQLRAEIKKNNRTFADIKFDSLSLPFQVLTWSPTKRKFLDLDLLFKATHTNPVGFDITLANIRSICVDPHSVDPSDEENIAGTMEYWLMPEGNSGGEFNNLNKRATILDTDWKTDKDGSSVNFTVKIIFVRYNLAPRICTGGITIIFSALALPL